MGLTSRLLVIFLCAGALIGCGKNPDSQRKPATNLPSPTRPNAPLPISSSSTPASSRSRQEVSFIRECLAAGLRPTILLRLENKALADAKGASKSEAPSKVQISDMRASFLASAAKLGVLANSKDAGKMADLAKILAQARAKQANECSRLPQGLLHEEGLALIMVEFTKISFEASNQQEADRKAGEHLKQNWPNLLKFPVQQKAAFKEILDTEGQIQQVIVELNKDAELQAIQQQSIDSVINELEARARKAAEALTPERFYHSLIGTGFPRRPWTFEQGELVKLAVVEQKCVGHCIVSLVRVDVRGKNSGKAETFDLNVAHKTYADGRVELLQVLER